MAVVMCVRYFPKAKSRREIRLSESRLWSTDLLVSKDFKTQTKKKMNSWSSSLRERAIEEKGMIDEIWELLIRNLVRLFVQSTKFIRENVWEVTVNFGEIVLIREFLFGKCWRNFMKFWENLWSLLSNFVEFYKVFWEF
jgi:hypothetical protein